MTFVVSREHWLSESCLQAFASRKDANYHPATTYRRLWVLHVRTGGSAILVNDLILYCRRVHLSNIHDTRDWNRAWAVAWRLALGQWRKEWAMFVVTATSVLSLSRPAASRRPREGCSRWQRLAVSPTQAGSRRDPRRRKHTSLRKLG